MMRVLLTSLEDTASRNIRDRLLELTSWDEVGTFQGNPVRMSGDLLLYEKPGLHLYFEDVDREISDHISSELGMDPSSDPKRPLDLLIFLSKHRSKKDIRSLTVHPPGNYLSADYGGEPGHLPPSAPREMTSALRSLYRSKKELDLKDRTTFEVTHHGPRISSPSFFIEIGSSEERWHLPELGKAIAISLLTRDEVSEPLPVSIGVGGGHYAPRFTDRAMRQKFDFGHMVPDYILSSAENIPECIRMAKDSTPGSEYIFLHRSKRNKDLLREVEATSDHLGLKIANPE
ncbi:MAG: D-aminoacyl-tRNA deacylase [Thermoplasmatota archaeon]